MIRNVFISFLNLFLFSNLFIAVCAMAQGALTYLLLGAPINPVIISLLGCSTLFLYNFSLFLSKPADFKDSPYKRIQWFFLNYKFVVSISVAALLAILLLLTKLSLGSLILLVSLSVLAISYNAPVLGIGRHRFGLRSIPGAKLFIIAGVWACICVWLPIMELRGEGSTISTSDTLLLISKRFLFVMAITLPFDIRDLYQDRIFQLKTIPVLIGEKYTMRLCQALLVVYLLFLFVFSENIDRSVLALTITIFFTSYLIFNTTLNKNEYYYFLLLDGTLFLQFAMVWMANYLS